MMRVASVCSGIGGAELAFHGIAHHDFAAETDPFARAVLAHRFPDMKVHHDFTQIPASAGPVDVLVGGTPCQSFSIAGLRGGMADERGNLALEFLRLAERLRARWVLWENVPGVLSSNDGRDFGAFIGGLAELGYGYCWRSLDAQHFGLAQRRVRVFVVGYLGDWRRAAAVLFEPASLRGHPAPSREAGKTTAPTLASRASAGGGLGTDFDCDGGLIAASLRGNSWCDNAGDESKLIAHSLRADGFDASEDGTGRGTPLAALQSSAVRRLTPRECERLQGFPDGWTDVVYRGKPAADGPRYRALGNAFAVNCVRWIAKRLVAEDASAQPGVLAA